MPHGTFVLADISGHSRYLDAAGLRHASNVTAHLLNGLIKAAAPHWTVAKLEGDAVFFLIEGREPSPATMAHIGALFRAFLEGILEIGQDTDCGCGACAGSNRLTLKFVVHSGEYESRQIGGREELIGPAVVVAHRLLKPGVRVLEYALFTRDYLGGDEPPVAVASQASVETEFGSVPFMVANLASLRREFEHEKQAFFSETQAVGRAEVEIDQAAGRVWDALLNPAKIREWSGMEDVIYFPARAGNFGSVYIWRPPGAAAFANVVVALDGERQRVTICRSREPDSGRVYVTYGVAGVSAASCLVTCDLGLPPANEPGQRATDPRRKEIQKAALAELNLLKRYCEAQAG